MTRGYECSVAKLSRLHLNVKDSFRTLISVPAEKLPDAAVTVNLPVPELYATFVITTLVLTFD